MNLKELIFREAFHQNFPLDANKFIDYCKKRGLNIDREYLEYLEKKRLFIPIMRVKDLYVDNTTDLKELYSDGCVIDPRQEKFTPWKEYYIKKDGYREEIVHTYYHPYQIYNLMYVLNSTRIRVSSMILEKNENEILGVLKPYKKYLDIRCEIIRKYSKKDELFVELLLFIQNKYLPRVKQPGHIRIGNIYSPLDNNLFEKWDELQKKIVPKEIFSSLGINIEKIKDFRRSIGGQGSFIDPLENWYDLIKYINYDKKQKLKGKALLAQDFYIISDMLALFLEDLTGEKQLETGSLSDSMQGRGIKRIYGKELNYIDRDILIRILREYGINPRPRLVLIVEGYTEETVFPIISNAMGIPFERFEIEIINIRGVDKSLGELIVYHSTPSIYQVNKKYHIHPERTKVFIIFDNEGNSKWIKHPDKEIEKMMKDVLEIIKKKKKKTNSKIDKTFLKDTVKYHIWDKSFEYDNFNDEELSIELNKYGKRYGCQFGVTPDEIKECRENNENLDKFIRKKTHGRTSLNKKGFGEQLANLLAKKIKERPDRFKNQRPIEKVLGDVIKFALEN